MRVRVFEIDQPVMAFASQIAVTIKAATTIFFYYSLFYFIFQFELLTTNRIQFMPLVLCIQCVFALFIDRFAFFVHAIDDSKTFHASTCLYYAQNRTIKNAFAYKSIKKKL